MKFLNFLSFSIFVGHFCPPGSGSSRPQQMRNLDMDPQHCEEDHSFLFGFGSTLPIPQLSNALTVGYAVAVYKNYSVVRDNKHLSLEYWKKFTSRQCCGSGLFIPDPGSWFLSVPNPTTATKEEGKNSFCPTFFCSQKYDKIKNSFFKKDGKKFVPIQIELNNFCPNSCHLALKN